MSGGSVFSATPLADGLVQMGKMLYLCSRKLHRKTIMESSTTHYVYQDATIEFVTVAAQVCLFMEHAEEHERADFIDKILCLLPLLYLKARLLRRPEQQMDGYPQQFVTEEDYSSIRGSVAGLLGSDDAYLEVYLEDMRYSDEPITAYISEDLADIYQELKDLAFNYQTADERVMNDALLACLEAFEQHWGQKVVNVLRPLHALSLAADE